MFTCHPRWFSGSYDVVDAAGSSVGEVAFEVFTEQGILAINGATYRVRKHGPMSGRWTLEHADGRAVAEARKPSAMFRAYDLSTFGGPLTLEPPSPFGRTFELRRGGTLVGRIAPEHPFTRRATVDCESSVPASDQLFAFWLAALAWRRAARRNNS